MSEKKSLANRLMFTKEDFKCENEDRVQQNLEKKIHYPNGYLVRRPE